LLTLLLYECTECILLLDGSWVENVTHTIYQYESSYKYSTGHSAIFENHTLQRTEIKVYILRVCMTLPRSGPPTLSPLASLSPPWTQRGEGNTRLWVRGGGPNSDDCTESLARMYSVLYRIPEWVTRGPLHMCRSRARSHA
jgi:hypothetical protein